MSFWLQLLVYTVVLIVYGRFIIWFYHYRNKREQRKFLMFLKMKFPDADIHYRSVSGKSEHDAFLRLVETMQEGGSKE